MSSYLAEHPEVVLRCAQLVEVVQVNQATVELAEGTSEQDFLENLGDTFTSDTYELFRRSSSRSQRDVRDSRARRLGGRFAAGR